MESKKFQTGQFVMFNQGALKGKRAQPGKEILRGIKSNIAYKIIRGVDVQNPGTIGIQVGTTIVNYSIFLFKPLTEEESKLAQLLEGF